MTIYIIVALAVALIVGLLLYQWYVEEKRRRELFAWSIVHGLSFSAERDYRLDSRFPEFDCLRRGENRYGYNLMYGRWRDRPIFGFDYHYETYSRDMRGRRQSTEHHRFSAVLVESEIDLKPLLIRPESALDKVAAFFGYDDIDFESAEFSRRFYVKSPDRRWAYDVIHPRTMEFLLASPQFTIEFGRRRVIAYRDSLFGAEDFGAAAEVICGILDRLPRYLVEQQRRSARLGRGGKGRR